MAVDEEVEVEVAADTGGAAAVTTGAAAGDGAAAILVGYFGIINRKMFD